jgi:hypothetical protein
MRRGVWIAVLVASVAGLALVWRASRTTDAVDAPIEATAPAPELAPQADSESAWPPAGEVVPPLAPDEESANPWASVDFEAAREALPDNVYWQLAAPTDDPRLQDEREREKARRNEQYGKLLSGTGTEAEIQDYYEYRQRMSSDYVRFVDWVLEHHGADLEERDLELLHTARRLHMARLREIPKRLQEAFDRKREQDAAREAWLRDEMAFDSEAEDGEATP